MDDIKSQLANRLKEANNVLVSVKNNPTVDQFAAAIGLTLLLNKLGKHATTVFSGTIPSTVEFLNPEKVVEQNTDSLRDFIISLDKSKADKLRYKIEDNFVKIFITPYHVSIGEKDLVFSQGDFNVDVVVALGVHQREELDQAITAHGRILHDATVTTINTQPPSNLGSINWSDGKSSSLCEMLVGLTEQLSDKPIFDAQISNSLLTGIVSETQRFSNTKTTSQTMSASSKLLAAGANQQLVATQLTPKPAPAPSPVPVIPPKPEEKEEVPKAPDATPPKPVTTVKKSNEGVLEINHGVKPDTGMQEEQVAQVVIDEQGTLQNIDPNELKSVKHDDDNQDSPPSPPMPSPSSDVTPTTDGDIQLPTVDTSGEDPNSTSQDDQTAPQQNDQDNAPNDSAADPVEEVNDSAPKLVLQPPTLKGELNSNESGSNTQNSFSDPSLTASTDNMPSQPGDGQLMDHDSGPASYSAPKQELNITPPPSEEVEDPTPPLTEINDSAPSIDEVRSAVNAALSGSPADMSNQPIESLNAQPVNLNLTPAPTFTPPPEMGNSFVDPSAQSTQPQLSPPTGAGSSMEPNIITPTEAAPQSQNAPPVPPPIIPLNDNDLPPAFTAL